MAVPPDPLAVVAIDGEQPAALRVVQWATGNIGTRSLRAVIEHPDLALAGVYVHSADKAGRDAGELCGLDATGVMATRDVSSRCPWIGWHP